MMRDRVAGRAGQGRTKQPDQQLVFDSCFRLLRARTAGGAPMPPLEVEYKSLWQPRNVAPRMDPIAVSRELEIRNAAPKRLPLGHRAALFIRRVARRFRAAAPSGCKWLKTGRRN